MKKALGWLCDPYIHMLLIAVVLVRMAMGVGGVEPASPGTTSLKLAHARESAAASESSDLVASRLCDVFVGE